MATEVLWPLMLGETNGKKNPKRLWNELESGAIQSPESLKTWAIGEGVDAAEAYCRDDG